MKYETDNWEYIPAKYQIKWNKPRQVLWIIVHDMEALETEKRARNCAIYFQNPPRAGSAQVCADDVEIIQCVHDNDQAAGAVGANQLGLHIEQPGFAAESPDQWQDEYSQKTLKNVAEVIAQWCLKYDIPIRKIGPAELKAHEKGICGHWDVSQAFPGTGHSDPGPNFPWDELIPMVQTAYDARKTKLDAMPDVLMSGRGQ